MEEVYVREEVYVGVRNWWSFLVRGLLVIAFGVLLLAWPASTVRVLAVLVGILALAEGIVETVWAFVLLSRKEKMALVLVRGLLGLLIGILLIAKTGFALTFVVVLVAVWAIFAGVVQLAGSQEMPRGSGRGWIALDGALSLVLGILLLAVPLETVFAIIVVLSIFLIAGGLVRIAMAFSARKLQKELAEA